MKNLMFRFKKIKWDKVLSAALVIVLLVGCIAGLAAITNKKTTDVSDFNFKKGALDSAGYYVESDTSIYTKDLIECQGLVIEPDFEATGNYQVFYYDSDKTFLGSTELMDAHLDGIYEKGDNYKSAKYCRIVISPGTPTDADGYLIEDWKIHFWEVASYADDYKITVNKKQTTIVDYGTNLFVPTEANNGKCCSYDLDTKAFKEVEISTCSYSVIDVSEINKLKFVYKNGDSIDYSYFFYDADNNYISGGNLPNGKTEFTINVPSGAVTFGVIYPIGTEYFIYEVA